jgi:signal transduction histidine kinase
MPFLCNRGAPPWWPAGEPWPPRQRRFGMDPRTRARFFRRAALGIVVLLVVLVSVTMFAAWAIAGRFGLVGWVAAIPVALATLGAAALIVLMLRTMGRFASPLGSVMDAADQVANGNYVVRVREYGPPPVRALAHSFNAMTERLQSADRLRRNLMADIAHELRTPVSVLQGRLEGLLDGVYPRDDRQLTQLLESTHMLSRLIDDLRVVALSDVGALPLHIEPTDLVRLVHEAVGSMQAEAAEKPVSIDVTPSVETAVLDVDAVRVREVITNLLSNAIRHTPAGRDVRVEIRDSTDHLSVTVTDTGEGMPPDAVAHMFDRFYKGSTSRGSGLGLSIAKGIVAAHGGEIRASSELGQGTAVTFTLPRSSSA